jgi:hypothetical protein
MSAGNGPADAAATFCDLLNDVSRLQREMGSDMVAWAKAYEAAGQAMQKNAETLALMAQVGRRGEEFLCSGPPAAAHQAIQFFLNPLQSVGATAASAAPGPFARFWEAWATAMPGAAGETGDGTT